MADQQVIPESQFEAASPYELRELKSMAGGLTVSGGLEVTRRYGTSSGA
jgi:hypothetical protein